MRIETLHVNQIDLTVEGVREFGPLQQKDIDRLADSIQRQGMLVPPIVVRRKDRYVVRGGNHRILAAQRLGKSHVDCLVLESEVALTNVELDGLIENITKGREMHPLDIAFGLKRILESGPYKTQAELAKAVGLSPSRITHYLNLTRLPRKALKIIQEKSEENASRFSITERILRPLTTLNSHPELAQEQIRIIRSLFENRWRDGEVEAAVEQVLSPPVPAPAKRRRRKAYVQGFPEGIKVIIRHDRLEISIRFTCEWELSEKMRLAAESLMKPEEGIERTLLSLRSLKQPQALQTIQEGRLGM